MKRTFTVKPVLAAKDSKSKLFNQCQAIIDDFSDDYGNDTLDTVYDRLTECLVDELGRELTDKECDTIIGWLQSNAFVFPEYDDEDYDEDEDYDPNL